MLSAPGAPLRNDGCRAHAGGSKAAHAIPARGRAGAWASRATSAQGCQGNAHLGLAVRASLLGLREFGNNGGRILLGSIKFLGAKRERAHLSELTKTSDRLPPQRLLALEMAWEYETGRAVPFPNSGEGERRVLAN